MLQLFCLRSKRSWWVLLSALVKLEVLTGSTLVSWAPCCRLTDQQLSASFRADQHVEKLLSNMPLCISPHKLTDSFIKASLTPAPIYGILTSDIFQFSVGENSLLGLYVVCTFVRFLSYPCWEFGSIGPDPFWTNGLFCLYF